MGGKKKASHEKEASAVYELYATAMLEVDLGDLSNEKGAEGNSLATTVLLAQQRLCMESLIT